MFKAYCLLDPQADLIKFEVEYWDLVKASREAALEEDFFHVDQARVSYSGHNVVGWTKKHFPLLYEDPRFKSSHVKCHFEGKPVQNPALLSKQEQSLIYTKIPELEEPF